MQECFLFSTPFPAFIVCRLFDEGHSDQCEVISHCSLDLHFSNNERCRPLFHVLAICISSLEKMSVWVLCSLFDWVFAFMLLICMSCLYILEINPLSVVSFAIILSLSEGCLFTLLIVSFAVQKLLSLIRSHLFTFVFYFHSRRWVIEDLALIYIIKCSACVFSKSFTVSGL